MKFEQYVNFVTIEDDPLIAETGWHYLDEAMLWCGPYGTEEEAIRILQKYVEHLESYAEGAKEKIERGPGA
jgi:hypothetical protein